MSFSKISTILSRNFLRLATLNARGMGSMVPEQKYNHSSNLNSKLTKTFSRSCYTLSNHFGDNSSLFNRKIDHSPCRCSSCRNASGAVAPQGDKELADFLKDEIKAESQISKAPKQGPGVPGFEATTKGSTVTLTKKLGNEVITVKFNINGTVDTEEPNEEDFANANQASQPPLGEMKSRPDFIIEITKTSGRSLAFNCRLYGDDPEIQQQAEDDNKGDKFEIESFAVLNKEQIDEEGDWDENIYMADGGIIDGQMYDLLMNYLDERGIGVEFAEHLVEYSTYYEHNQYVSLLENLKSFLESK